MNFVILAFDTNEEKRIQEELDAYNAALEDEMEREKQKHQRNLEALNHRKEDMIKEKKQKLKVSIYYSFPFLYILVFTYYRKLQTHSKMFVSG